MNVAHPIPRQLVPWQVLARGVAGLLLAFLLACFGTLAQAAAPAANSVISNQATATYSDGSNTRNVSSNQVLTTVTQVYAVDLATPGTRTATPGSLVYFPHTVTNTGNGTDSFGLSAVSDATPFTLNNVQIFLDDGSGQPTGSAITATPQIAAGATFKFVVSAIVPAAAGAGAANQTTVTATSAKDSASKATNVDKTTVTVYANITLSKSATASTGAPGFGPYTYKIEYRNTGNQDATDVAIGDILPAGINYVPNSVKWNGGSAITDGAAPAGSPATIGVTAATANGRTTVTATISKVALNTSGYITFDAKIDDAAGPGVLQNTAAVSYFNGNANAANASNQVDFTVTQVVNLTMTSPPVASAKPGDTVTFVNTVTNTGTGSDTFNITLSNNKFPAGSQVELLMEGGTALADTDGDGTPDTGPLAPKAVYKVIVRVKLPNDAGGNNGGNGWSIDKTATSKANPLKTAVVTDTLTTIALNKVDLAHTSAATGAGIGPGAEASAVQNLLVKPGAATVFTLFVKNTGASADGYNLTASTSSTVGTTALPTGWTVEFRADASGAATACSVLGATITSTPTVNANASYPVCAVLTVPAGYVAGQQELYFAAASSTSGKSDVLHDAVTVEAVRTLSLTPNRTGQTYPGGTFVYGHTLKNTGNVDESTGTQLVSALSQVLANDGTNWTATLYVSTNATFGDSDDQVVTTGDLSAVLPAGLPRGTSVTLFVKVQAPSGAAAGALNTTTLTITTSKGTYTADPPGVVQAIDSTTVISGNLSLEKKQALDTACSGTVAPGAFTMAQLDAKPGECVMYQITVTNIGAADAGNVVVSDATPTFTTLSATAPVTAVGGTVVAGTGGQFKVNVGTGASASAGGTLSAGQSAVITFGVKIDK